MPIAREKAVHDRYWQTTFCVFGAKEVQAALRLVTGGRGVIGRLQDKADEYWRLGLFKGSKKEAHAREAGQRYRCSIVFWCAVVDLIS